MSTALEIDLVVGEAAPPLARHVKVTGAAPALGFEPCEDAGCSVDVDGNATSCRRIACPACGCSGTNLSTIELVAQAASVRIRCTCGYSWVRAERRSF